MESKSVDEQVYQPFNDKTIDDGLVIDFFPLPKILTDQTKDNHAISKIFEDACPYYMMLGMTYEEYWNGDSDPMKYYREMDRLKQKRKNQESYRQGMYIYDALCCVAPILHPFAKKGTTANPYPSEPYPMTREELEEKKKRDIAQKKKSFISRLHDWKDSVNKNIQEK